MCNGQLLSIQQNAALFSLLGTMYGGNGIQTFALPDLRCRVPLHFGTDPNSGTPYVEGQQGGLEAVTLSLSALPIHTHGFSGTLSAANDKRPRTGAAFAQSKSGATSPADSYYASSGSLTALNAATLSTVGSSQPHTNVQPYLTVNWCIALQGIFPSRN